MVVELLVDVLVVDLDDDCLVYELGWVYLEEDEEECLEEEGLEKDEEDEREAKRVAEADAGEDVLSSLLELLLELWLLERLVLLLEIAEVAEVAEALVLLLEEDVLNLILFLGNGNVFHSDFQPSSPGCKRKH
jgi:hypothetical protein